MEGGGSPISVAPLKRLASPLGALFERSLGALGRSWGRLGALLGPSWSSLEALLGPSLEPWRASWGYLGGYRSKDGVPLC